MHDRPGGGLQEESHLLSPFAQFASEQLTIEDAIHRGIGPHGFVRPIPFGGKRREQPSVDCAAERDRVVGHRKDVLPEGVAGPEGLHGGEVGAPARVNGIVRRRRRRAHHDCVRIRAAHDDIPCSHRNRSGQRCDYECQAETSPMSRHPAQICNRCAPAARVKSGHKTRFSRAMSKSDHVRGDDFEPGSGTGGGAQSHTDGRPRSCVIDVGRRNDLRALLHGR